MLELGSLNYGVIYGGNPYAEGYYKGYDHLSRNIYEAIRYSGSSEEWNWWEGYWGIRLTRLFCRKEADWWSLEQSDKAGRTS